MRQLNHATGVILKHPPFLKAKSKGKKVKKRGKREKKCERRELKKYHKFKFEAYIYNVLSHLYLRKYISIADYFLEITVFPFLPL